MNTVLHVFPLLLLALSTSGQAPFRDPAPALGRSSARVAAAEALLGVWVATGEDKERLEFRRGGVLLVDGVETRYRTNGNRLSIAIDGQSLTGTWRVVEPHLLITLSLPDGGSRSEGYRRETIQAAPDVRRERAAAGCATFELPNGWSIARTDDDSALLDLGLRAPDTLDALIVVTSGDLPDDVRNRPATELLRSRLSFIIAELAQLQVEFDPARIVVRAIALPGGNGAELTVGGTSGGEHPVSVWIGAARNETQFACVLAVVVAGREERFMPGAASVLRSLRFTAAAARPSDDAEPTSLAGLRFGNEWISGTTSRTIEYTLGANGTVRARKMFSSSVGGSDRTTSGTFTVHGDALTMHIDNEVVEAAIERNGAEIQALRIGGTRYRRL